MTQVRPRRVRPAERAFELVLRIDETAYTIRPVPGDPLAGDGRGYRLRKADGTLYDVGQTPFGPTCDCPDFIFRRDGLDPAGCKHVRALAAFGLIAPGIAAVPVRGVGRG